MAALRCIRGCLAGVAVVLAQATVSAQIASLPATISLRSVDGVTVPFQNGIPVPAFEPQHRPAVNLAGSWRKLRFTADHNITLGARDAAGYAAVIAEAAGRHLPSFVDTAWASMTLPAVENVMHAYGKTPEYYENGVWYRRAFAVPDSLRNHAAILKFLAVNYVADVWLNGTYLGWHEGGYTPFAFDVTPLLHFDSSNVLAVRVDNPPWNPGQTTVGVNRRIDMVPYYTSDWFNYTGIIHDVLLEFPDSVAIPRVDIVPLDVQGTISVGVTIRNRGHQAQSVDLTVQVCNAVIDSSTIDSPYPADLAGSVAPVSGTTQASLTVAKDSCRAWTTTLTLAAPRLWSPKQPNLYIMKVTVSQSGRVLDEFATQFGVRTIATSGSKLLLNGQAVYLPGTARHEDHPVYGRSIPRDVIAADLRTVRTLNAALLRTAHYPNHPYTYMMADRLGLAIVEEIPVWWFDTDLAWVIQNGLRHIHTQMFREMVFRDFNRPSILFWSTCNECLAVTGRQQFISEINAEIKGRYPDGRLVTQSAAADRPGASDPTQASCDIAGWTMYFGIFHGGTYYDGTKQFLLDAHASQPNKPIMDTEFGYWSSENGSTAPAQVVVLDSTFRAFAEVTAVDSGGAVNPSGFLAATTWWTAFDWYTCQQPSGYESMGVYQMDRTTPKPVAAALAALYRPYYAALMTTGVGERPAACVATVFRLDQNYPNPFNPETQIRYALPQAGPVTLRVYDLLGRELATLVNAVQPAGDHAVAFAPGKSGGALASGVYFYRLESGPAVAVQKMMFLK